MINANDQKTANKMKEFVEAHDPIVGALSLIIFETTLLGLENDRALQFLPGMFMKLIYEVCGKNEEKARAIISSARNLAIELEKIARSAKDNISANNNDDYSIN